LKINEWYFEIYLLFLLQFDVLVASLPISETGEEAQLKRIAELQVWDSQLSNCSLLIQD
jgi:hypothetical protein